MSKKISKWIETRREANLAEMVKQHTALIMETVRELASAVDAALRGDMGEALKSHERNKVAEREADSMKRRIAEEIAKSEMEPPLRADMLKLDRSLDSIGDWALESSRILEILISKSKLLALLNQAIKEKCREMARETTECADQTMKAIESAVANEPQKALDLSERAERLEERVDGLYQDIRAAFVEARDLNLTSAEAFLFFQFVDGIENTADRCEQTCDQVRVVSVRGF